MTDVVIGNYCRVSVYWTIGDTNIQFFVLVFPQHHSGMVLKPNFWYYIVEWSCEFLLMEIQGHWAELLVIGWGTLRIIVLILSIMRKLVLIFLLVHCSTLTTIRTSSSPHFNVTCPPLFFWLVELEKFWFHSVLCIVLISYIILILVAVFSRSSPLTVNGSIFYSLKYSIIKIV